MIEEELNQTRVPLATTCRWKSSKGN